MVEKKPVNVKLQMIFSVIPFLDCYASYKIQRWRLWFFIFWICGTIVGVIHGYALFGENYFDIFTETDYLEDSVHLANYVLFIIVFASIQAIVMRKLSKKWNESLRDENKI